MCLYGINIIPETKIVWEIEPKKKPPLITQSNWSKKLLDITEFTKNF